MIKKKSLAIVWLGAVLLLFGLSAQQVYADNTQMKIFVDNVPALSTVAPYESQGTLLVPVRFISEELGASVQWGGKQVHIQGEGADIVLTVGEKTAVLNGEGQTLAVAPQMKQGSVFVPLRFIGEALSAKVIYRDNKLFLYTTKYDDSLATKWIFQRDGVTYASLEGNLFRRPAGAEQAEVISTGHDNVSFLRAVSNSGLLYSYWTRPANSEYYLWSTYAVYSFADGQSRDVYTIPLDIDPDVFSPFTDCGKYFFTDYAESKESDIYVAINGVKIPVEERQSYRAIFSVDIDGTNKKEILVEENHYGIWGLTYYNGWLYYQRRVPVAQEWGYDTYAGSINRIPAEGGERQQLTTEGGGDMRIGEWSVQEDGLHYEQNRQEHILAFADMKNIN